MLRPLILLAVASSACCGHWTTAEASVERPLPTARRMVQVDGRLRSAFLLRATGRDESEPAVSAEIRQERLREHFTLVLEVLDRNSRRALDGALDRLEQHRGERWSADEREEWRLTLARERLLNIQRLHRYQQRGLFPINEHHSCRSVPVFVDNKDTACAVGYLMRESGWEIAVEKIRSQNNLVYVTDVVDGPLVEWVAYSGLIQEEAALIQPGYGIAPNPDAEGFVSQLGAPDSIGARGLSYGKFYAGDPISSRFSSRVFQTIFHPASEVRLLTHNLRASLRHGPGFADQSFGGESFTPVVDRWMNVWGGLGTAGPNQYSYFQYAFEVTAVNDDERISSVSLLSNYVIGNLAFGGGEFDGTAFAGMEVLSEHGQLLGEEILDTINSPTTRLEGRRIVSFAPQKRVSVIVTTFAYDSFSIWGLGHEVNLTPVPEPALASLILLPGVVVGAAARRRRGVRLTVGQGAQLCV
jgi:hypothetical protein